MGRRDEDLLSNIIEGTVEEIVTELTVEGIKWAAKEIIRASQSRKQLELSGSVGYATSGSMVTITADKILNNRNGRSGTLMLMLWATNSVYNGGTITGYVFGSTRFDPLQSRYEYPNIIGIYDMELFQEIRAKVGDRVEIRIIKELQPDFSETTTFTFISHLKSGNGSNIISCYPY